MRVLFVTQTVDRAHVNLGAVHGWIAALAEEVDEVHAVALSTGVVDLPPNVFVNSLGKDRGHGKAGQLLAFKSVVGRLVRSRQVDVFFAHMVPRYAMLLAPYRLLYGIPTAMWYAHNTADLRLKLAYPFVDRFVTVSRDSFPMGLAKCDVVGHGIDTDVFRPTETEDGEGTEPPGHQDTKGPNGFPLPEGEGQGEGYPGGPAETPTPTRGEDPVRFLSLGRVSPRKDQDLLVSAADVLVNQWGCQNVEFVIAGGPLVPEDRVYYDGLRERVAQLALDRFFQFTGSVPHSATVRRLQSCDFFVNMHAEGGLGKAVLEAMSCGKPAFVSTSTYYEAFPEYGKAFLFAARDAQDLAAKMRAGLEMSGKERRRIGADLREWVQREHDVHRQMSRVAGIIRALTGG